MIYGPLVPDVAVRSQELQGSQQLDPLADFPALFSCKVNGVPAIGCVYRNGAVFVLPDFLGPGHGPYAFQNMRAVDESEFISDIVWEWQVTRRVAEDLIRLAPDGS